MNRKEWMLPEGDSIGRSLTPSQTGRTTGRAKRASLLLACAAAALILSSMALMYMGSGEDMTEPTDDIQRSRQNDTPVPPWNIMGITFADVAKTTPLPGCTVNVTNLNTGLYVVLTSNEYGFYEYDMNLLNTTDEDVIHVFAQKDLLYGEETAIADKESGLPFLPVDVVVDLEIPEFPAMSLLPVVGAVALLVVLRHRRKK